MSRGWMSPVESEPPSAYGDRVADVYDEWYADIVNPMPAVLMLAGIAGRGRVLELGIGTGRVALPLLAFGIDVSGIEASEAMVEKLRAKPGGELIDVAIGDFADVAVEGPFSLIYIPFNTLFWLASQEEQIRCLRNVAGRLDVGGSFVLDAFVPFPWQYVDNQRTRVSKLELDKVTLDLSHMDPVSQRITSSHIVLTNDDVLLYPLTIRYAWPAEIDAMAEAAGLRLEARYGFYDRRPFDSSSRQHVSIYKLASDRG